MYPSDKKTQYGVINYNQITIIILHNVPQHYYSTTTIQPQNFHSEVSLHIVVTHQEWSEIIMNQLKSDQINWQCVVDIMPGYCK